MIGAIVGTFVVLTTRDLMGDKGFTNTNPLNHTFGNDFTTAPAVQLVFYGRTSAIQSENIHGT
jgi:hypothetical protein